MYSICIKFKDELNWRPLCRQFEDADQTIDFINDAFDKWHVKHCSVFIDGVFKTCYRWSPRTIAKMNAAVQKMRSYNRSLYGNYINR